MRIVPADRVRPVVTGRHVGPRTAPVVWKEKTTEVKGKVVTLTPNSMSQVAKKKRMVKLAYDDDDDKLMGDAKMTKKQHTDLGSNRELESEHEESTGASIVQGDSLGEGLKGRQDLKINASKSVSESKPNQRKRGTSDWLAKKLKLGS